MERNTLVLYLCGLLLLVSSMTLSWKLPAGNKIDKEEISTADHKEASPKNIPSTSEVVDNQIAALYNACEVENSGLKSEVFKNAYIGFLNLKEKKKIPQKATILSVVDFDLSSKKKRLWIIDLEKRQLLLNTWVSHGRGSGAEIATRFSNVINSHQSSLGFYITGEVYYGKHGRSLRLDGMDDGFNNKARERAIVLHGASYVSAQAIRNLDRLGLSYGCPAVPLALSSKIIDLVKDRTVLYIHANVPSYHSAFLDEEEAGRSLLASFVENNVDSLSGRL